MTRSERTRNRWPAAALALSLAACGGSEAGTTAEWQAAYDTIGDTIVVRTLGGSVWGEPAQLVPFVTIGTFEGADEYMFGRVRSLAVASDGSIYAYDSHANELRKYAPDGTYVATFGREGGGPGEYREPDGGLAVLPDGRVLLRDPGNARISVFSPDGEYIEGWRILGGIHTSRPLYVDAASNCYTILFLNPADDFGEWRFGLLRLGPDGSPADTLPAPVWDYEPAELVATTADGEGMSMNEVPFTPVVSWTFSPLGYMVGGLPTRYAFELFIAPNRVLRIERADWTPARVLAAEKDEQERIVTADLRQVDPAWRWNADPIPEAKPPYNRIYIGQYGRIWVHLHQEAVQIESADVEEVRPGEVPPQTWIEPVAFDVFEPDGRYLGMVRAPEGFSTNPQPVMRGDTVWAVVRGEMDVPYIVRLQIEHRDET